MEEQLPRQFGAYTLHELIDRGGMAEVYRATMSGLGGFEKPVAIKKILPHLAEDEEFATMLVDEARIIVNIEHANIAQVYDLGEREGTYYIAMEYVHGIDLDTIISTLSEADRRIPIPHLLYIGSKVAEGLHVAHSKTDDEGRPLNVVHRDLSPHNILVSFSGGVKIIDFGVAKASVKQARTQMGVIKGKLLYMSPEQARDEDIDGQTDLFALGLCLYKALTDELPFQGANEYEVYQNILSRQIPPPRKLEPDVPEKLDRIVMKLLERDRQKRYKTGYAVKKDLENLLRDLSPSYTDMKLSRFIEKYFSEDAEQLADAAYTNQQTKTEHDGEGAADGSPFDRLTQDIPSRTMSFLDKDDRKAEKKQNQSSGDTGHLEPTRPIRVDEDDDWLAFVWECVRTGHLQAVPNGAWMVIGVTAAVVSGLAIYLFG